MVKLAGNEHRSAATMLANEIRIVRHNDHPTVAALVEQFVIALLMKALVADRDDLVDEETVEFDHHRNRKRQPRPHSRRIGFHRLLQVNAKLGKLLDELNLVGWIDTVDAADETEVVETGQSALERAAERERPRNAHAPLDQSCRRQLRSADEPDQRRLAGSIPSENSDALAASDGEIDVAKHVDRTRSRRVDLVDV